MFLLLIPLIIFDALMGSRCQRLETIAQVYKVALFTIHYRVFTTTLTHWLHNVNCIQSSNLQHLRINQMNFI